jgi:hypothetical protein
MRANDTGTFLDVTRVDELVESGDGSSIVYGLLVREDQWLLGEAPDPDLEVTIFGPSRTANVDALEAIDDAFVPAAVVRYSVETGRYEVKMCLPLDDGVREFVQDQVAEVLQSDPRLREHIDTWACILECAPRRKTFWTPPPLVLNVVEVFCN